MENMIVMTIMNDTVTARINMNDVNIVKNILIQAIIFRSYDNLK